MRRSRGDESERFRSVSKVRKMKWGSILFYGMV
jgi:hypothetical protein